MLQALPRTTCRPLTLAVVAALGLCSGISHAQTETPPESTVRTTTPIGKPAAPKPNNFDLMHVPPGEREKYREMDKLTFHGWLSNIPGFEDTLLQDTGGFRSALASAGIGFSLQSSNLLAYDFAQAGGTVPGPQLYNGQSLTLQTSYQNAILTYDLGKIGITGGQLVVMNSWNTNGYQTKNGKRGVRTREYYWYQSLLQDRVNFEVGSIANANEFAGTHVGGDLAGGSLGPQASILVESGMSYGQYGAPTASVRVNWTKHFYTHTAVQRSLEPVGGSSAEDKNNPRGFTFHVPGGNALYIQEFGYNVPAKAGTHYTWIRGGGDYNTSHYSPFDGGAPRDNHMLYLGADHQLVQTSSTSPAHGLYIGTSIQSAPKALNLISRYYEARIYLKAPFASRPRDLTSFVVNSSGYSKPARIVRQVGNYDPSAATRTYTFSYNYFVMHGLYLQAGLSLIQHPVYNRDIGNAVNGLVGVTAYF